MHDDDGEAAVQRTTCARDPKDPINHSNTVEVPQMLALHRRKPHTDDSRSVGTISTSYSKVHSTFSAPYFEFHMHSPSATTPTTSRHQSPTRLTFAPSKAMEHGLVGIGDHIKAMPSGKFTADLPILSRNPHLPETQLSWDGGSTPKQPTPSTDMNTTPEASTGCQESDSDSEICRSDLDLERAANIALSRCFGVGLDRLSRPIRVIEAFSEFKGQCADILREEVSFSTIDWDDDGFSCYDVEEGEASHGNSAGDLSSNRAQQSESRTNKRPAEKQSGGGGHDEASRNPGQGQGQGSRTRHNKRRRIEGSNFSCPFRKRNPWRFNVRDFDACANVSYPDMTSLKRHVSAQHYTQSCQWCWHPRMGEDHSPEDCILHRRMKTYSDSRDPEAGVDKDTDDILKSRAPGIKIKDWQQLWRLLFPRDEVPSHTFEPVIEHHDIAAHGYKQFILETAEDIMDFIQRPRLSVDGQMSVLTSQSLQEIIHQKAKVLLRGSMYAEYERCEKIEGSETNQTSARTKGKSTVPVMNDESGPVSDDGELLSAFVAQQPWLQKADTMRNGMSTGLQSSSIFRERPLAPKTGQTIPPTTPHEICPPPNVLMQNTMSVSHFGGDQDPSALDLPSEITLDWSDIGSQSLQGASGDGFQHIALENEFPEDFFSMSSMNTDSVPDHQLFGGPWNGSST